MFKPTPKDEGKLSVYDGDQITAERSYEHFTSRGLTSVGVMSVSVVEVKECALEPVPDPEAFPEHVVVDYAGLTGGQIEKKAKLLKVLAETRGWQFRAEVL